MEVDEQLLAAFVQDRSGFRTGKRSFAFSSDDTAIGFCCPFFNLTFFSIKGNIT